MDILAKIAAYKAEELAERRRARPLSEVEAAARAAPPVRPFLGALRAAEARGGYALIAEIKKASPSKGLIRAEFEPATLARAYEAGGATCLSVLTDGPSFQGADAHLDAARGAVALPALRKDFLLDPYQVAEARALGADCILVILAMVSDAEAGELVAAAQAWGMDALLEVHDRAELDRALALPSPLVGINNRNLKTFETRLETTETLAPLLPEGTHLVAESGLVTPGDLARLAEVGARSFLIGESLMRAEDVAAATRALLSDPAPPRRLTHFDGEGRARMVDVGAKPDTERTATAQGRVVMAPETLTTITEGRAKKGDVLAVARLAGIMAAKRTADLIPLCHPLMLTKVTVDLTPAPPDTVEIEATVKLTGKTGVEMEALTAVSVAALTVYDMTKALDRGMRIEGIHLVHKAGGKSGEFRAEGAA